MKTLYTILILGITNFSLLGQGSNPLSLSPINVTPPSPSAAALGKYGEVPVQLYTGVPSIAIPLYTIATPKLNVPIGISYHSSGIKVEEIASSVGLGWAMNAGGVITRSIVGQADEGSGGFILASTQTKMQQFKNQTMSISEREQFEVDVADGNLDTEPDLFYYNFVGQSGKMMYTNTGEMVPVDHQNIRITKTSLGFEIVDESGVKYTFETPETTEVLTNCGTSQSPNGLNETSWYLTKISPPIGREITFSYVSTFASVFSGRGETDARYKITNPSGCNPSSSSTTQSCRTRINGNYLRLSQINFENGTVTFSYSDRTDANGMKKLDSFEVRNLSNELIKSFAFTYSYSTPNFRLFLDKLEETTSAINPPIYNFTYTNRNALPAYGSYAQDYWGYFNANTQSTLIPLTTIPGIYLPRTVWANRDADPSKANVGMLERITYPTRGYTEFTFEGHDYGYWFVSPVSNGSLNYKLAGGTRIKQIKNFDANDAPISEKLYEYRETIDPSRSSGMLVQEPTFAYAYTSTSVTFGSGTVGGSSTSCDQYILSSSSHSYLGASNGNHITYKEVTEYNAADKQTRGKTVHTFTSHFEYPDSPVNIDLPFEPNTSKEYLRGKPLASKNFKYLASTYTPLQTVENDYTPTTIQNIEGLKIRFSNRISYNFSLLSQKQIDSVKALPQTSLSNTGLNGTAEYAFYLVPVTWMYVNHTSTTQQETTGSVVTDNYFTYNNQHLQLSEFRSLRSTSGNERIILFRYPRDFNIPSGINLDNPSQAIRQLRVNHIENVVVEERHYEKTGSLNLLSATILTQYMPAGNGLPSKVFRYVPGLHIDNYPIPFINGAGVFQQSSRLKEQYRYELFDAFGNLQQLRLKSGLVNSYAWGYDSKYPIIEGTGIDYASMIGVNSNLTTLSNENDIVAATNQLRAAFPLAQFSNYVHTPLKGLTSQNQSNGIKSSFAYDGFLRLEQISDNQANITDRFTYSYATTATAPPTPSNLQWDVSRNTCSNTDAINSIFEVFVTGIGTGAGVEFSIDGTNWYVANNGADGYLISIPYAGGGNQSFTARPSDNPVGGAITVSYAKCAFSGSVAAPSISISSSTLCTINLSASGCTGTVDWSNGSTGTSISVSSGGSMAISATCTFGNVTSAASNVLDIPILPSTWSSVDIGSSTSGCTQATSGNLTMQSNGSLGGSSPDNIHYVYRSITGDFTIIAKVNSLTVDDGDRAGIMIRGDLSTQAPDFSLFQDGNTFVGTFHRLSQGTDNVFGSFQQATLGATWLKVVKTGNDFAYYYSTDPDPEANSAWLTNFSIVSGTNPQPVNVGSTYLIGFATWGNATQATFSNITINGQNF